MRSEPAFVLILQETAYSSGPRPAKAAKGGESRPSVSASSGGTGENSTPAYRSSVFSRKIVRSMPSR